MHPAKDTKEQLLPNFPHPALASLALLCTPERKLLFRATTDRKQPLIVLSAGFTWGALQVAFLLPIFQKLEGPGGLYLGFAGMAALSWVVIYFIVIETKMKTLEEIEAIMVTPKKNLGFQPMNRYRGAQPNVQLSKQDSMRRPSHEAM